MCLTSTTYLTMPNILNTYDLRKNVSGSRHLVSEENETILIFLPKELSTVIRNTWLTLQYSRDQYRRHFHVKSINETLEAGGSTFIFMMNAVHFINKSNGR